MAYLIRFISRNAAGGVEHLDRTINTPLITIGRSTDQVLHLKDRRTRLQHATIEPRGSAVHITTNALAGVTVNSKSQRDAELKIGDVVEVGANIIRVIDVPDGFDFAISFELSEDADSDHLVSKWSTPTQGLGGVSKRKIAWLLVAAVFLFGFVVPKFFLQNFLSAGPINSAHVTIGDDCKNCHVAAFQRVPDDACISCHTVQRHTSADEAAVVGETRCATCHQEHNEPPQLINQHQGLCANCHADLSDDHALLNAADFLDDHPDFRVSLLRPPNLDTSTAEWVIEHVQLTDSLTAEQSNLKFNHKVHLAADGIMTPEGNRVVECVECHTPDAAGARMQAISMDENCSSCHTLAFDPDDPTRTVPHGDAEAVVQTLIEYYSARLLGSDPDAVQQRVRRPGQQLSRTDRDRVAAEARTEALSIAEDLFERRACINCHTVTKTGGELPWHVDPVRLTSSFFPHANFSHAKHNTEAFSCDGCHDAANSEAANDVLMPGINVCRDCHGSGESRRNDSAQVPSTCVMCHGFHSESKDQHP